MTNEEASKIIYKQWQEFLEKNIDYAGISEAYKMAIQTLEQESYEDAISRQALLKLMGEEPFNWTDSVQELQEVEDYRNFRNMVEQLPSVKPQEPKTGYREYNDIYDHYLCGNCKTVVMDYDNFCPNCGAKMN